MRYRSNKTWKKVIAAVLAAVLCLSVGSAFGGTSISVAKEKNDKVNKELTEEEKKAKEELEKAYKISTESNKWEGWKKGPGTYGEAAIVMEADTGAILYAKNIDSKQYPASITKVLTALVALENSQMSDKVTFSHDCVSFLQPGDSSVGLKEGNVITMEQALYAMLLASANEAAYAVGENTGKNLGYDYDWFINRMNERVKELGGVNSNFVNTNGLHDKNHYTCARDMALIGRELFKHPEFFKIVQTLQYTIPKSKTVEEHVFQQKHKMLQPQNSNYYKYAVGGKTGFTSDAKSTLITMAEKDDVKLVCVVLRTYGKNVYPDTRNLLKYAFKNFQKTDVSTLAQPEGVAEVLGNTENIENAESTENVESTENADNTAATAITDSAESESAYIMLPKKADTAKLETQITADGVGSDEGTLTYTYSGNAVGTVRVRLTEEYLRANSLVEEEPKISNATQDTDSDKKGHKEPGWLTKLKKFDKFGLLEKTGLADRLCEMSHKERIALDAAAIVLAALVVLFIVSVIVISKKSKRR